MAKLTYLEETHQYFIGKKEVPSVSKLVEFACGEYLSNVPQDVLQKAAEYGTFCHDAIQQYEENGNIVPFTEEVVEKYKELKNKYLLSVQSMEQMVTDGKNFGGRYDILDTDGTLWDIKTTSKPYLEKWAWQISIYQYGLGKPKDVGYVIYIPKKGKHKVLMLNLHSFEEVKELINMYNEQNG